MMMGVLWAIVIWLLLSAWSIDKRLDKIEKTLDDLQKMVDKRW